MTAHVANMPVRFEIVSSETDLLLGANDKPLAAIICQGPGDVALYVQADEERVSVVVFDASLVDVPLVRLLASDDILDSLTKASKVAWTGVVRFMGSRPTFTWTKDALAA